MWRTSILWLSSFILGTLSNSPSLLDFQEQFSELSRSIEPQLRDYRAENEASRDQVVHRMLDALGNLTIEMRNITRDYWTRIESHELANPECLERVREEFDSAVRLGEQDIQSMAIVLERYMSLDAAFRFNPVVRRAQQENSQTIYQVVHTLGRNQFVGNMTGTMDKLQNELEFYRNQWEVNQERLQQELYEVRYLLLAVEDRIEWWHDFTVTWHLMFMERQLESVYFECSPDSDSKDIRVLDGDIKVAKRLELMNSKMNGLVSL